MLFMYAQVEFVFKFISKYKIGFILKNWYLKEGDISKLGA